MQTKTILVPIDFSDYSKLALKEADDLAVASGGTLVLLHVVQITEVAVMDFVYATPANELSRLTEKAKDGLEQWASELKTPADRISTRVDVGEPSKLIAENSEDVDLVVMATHGHTGLKHLLMGSVAERVARRSKSSVLIVRRPS